MPRTLQQLKEDDDFSEFLRTLRGEIPGVPNPTNAGLGAGSALARAPSIGPDGSSHDFRTERQAARGQRARSPRLHASASSMSRPKPCWSGPICGGTWPGARVAAGARGSRCAVGPAVDDCRQLRPRGVRLVTVVEVGTTTTVTLWTDDTGDTTGPISQPRRLWVGSDPRHGRRRRPAHRAG